MSKTTDHDNWDTMLSQCVAAYNMFPSESTGFSPFFLLYGREPYLPLDTILKPRRRYMGEEEHKIALEQQHKAFKIAHRNLKKAKRRRNDYANKNATEVSLDVGQAVLLKNNARKSKLDHRYTPYYRIIEKKTPVTFVIKNILTGKSVHAHARNIKKATVDDWDVSDLRTDERLRRAAYVVPPSESDSESSDSSSNDERPKRLNNRVKRLRRERSDSSASDTSDIPLAEVQRKLRRKRLRENSISDNDTPLTKLRKQVELKRSVKLPDINNSYSGSEYEPMDVSENDRPSTAQINAVQQSKYDNSVANNVSLSSNRTQLKSLFESIAAML
jgi:hypothetical protein